MLINCKPSRGTAPVPAQTWRTPGQGDPALQDLWLLENTAQAGRDIQKLASTVPFL